MFSRLFALFVIVPLIELALLIQVGQWIGLVPTVALVLATGAAGAALARREGLRTVQRIQSEVAAARVPGDALLDGAAILVGGAFLLTPGVLTDLVGLSLLLPPTRGLLKRRIRRAIERQIQEGGIQLRMASFGPGMGGMSGSGFGGVGFGGPGFGSGAEPGDDDDSDDRPVVEIGGPGTDRPSS